MQFFTLNKTILLYFSTDLPEEILKQICLGVTTLLAASTVYRRHVGGSVGLPDPRPWRSHPQHGDRNPTLDYYRLHQLLKYSIYVIP